MTESKLGPGRPALLHLQSWAGRSAHRVSVLSETAKNYRVRFDEDAMDKGATGQIKLVPKRAVTLVDPEQALCVNHASRREDAYAVWNVLLGVWRCKNCKREIEASK